MAAAPPMGDAPASPCPPVPDLADFPFYGTLVNGGVTVIAPDGSSVEHLAVDDLLVTNIAFGGADLRTAFLTASGTGRLLACEWPRPGLRLAHQ